MILDPWLLILSIIFILISFKWKCPWILGNSQLLYIRSLSFFLNIYILSNDMNDHLDMLLLLRNKKIRLYTLTLFATLNLLALKNTNRIKQLEWPPIELSRDLLFHAFFFLRFYLNYKQCCNSWERDNFSDSYSFLFLSNNCSQINILRMYKLYLKYYYFVTDQKLYVIKYLKKILWNNSFWGI